MELVANANSIRKKWLTSFKANFYYQMICGFVFLVLAGLASAGGESSEEWLSSGIRCFLCMPWFYLAYKCACKKPGTKFLTIALYLSVGGIVKSLHVILQDFDVLSLVFVLVDLAFFVWFFNRSTKLIKLNKQIKMFGVI